MFLYLSYFSLSYDWRRWRQLVTMIIGERKTPSSQSRRWKTRSLVLYLWDWQILRLSVRRCCRLSFAFLSVCLHIVISYYLLSIYTILLFHHCILDKSYIRTSIDYRSDWNVVYFVVVKNNSVKDNKRNKNDRNRKVRVYKSFEQGALISLGKSVMINRMMFACRYIC